MNAKAELRRQMKALRDAIPEAERRERSRYIWKTAAEMAQPGEKVFVYASTGSEVQTGELIRALWDKGCRVCLPKITGRGTMDAVEYGPGDVLKSDRYGIPAPENGTVIPPEEVQAAFVPALAFDARGNRLGYGGGYYDRWLALSGARRILLAYGLQRADSVFAEEWDIPMDAVVTEREILRFR